MYPLRPVALFTGYQLNGHRIDRKIIGKLVAKLLQQPVQRVCSGQPNRQRADAIIGDLIGVGVIDQLLQLVL